MPGVTVLVSQKRLGLTLQWSGTGVDLSDRERSPGTAEESVRLGLEKDRHRRISLRFRLPG
ncbi:hypothetical protein GCM10009835_04720 [Planosporangium flavigriseum]